MQSSSLADAPNYMADQILGPLLANRAPSAAQMQKQGEMFFGPGIFNSTTGSSSDIAYVNYNPSHFAGSGLYLATTISGLVGLNNDWAVMALPIVKTNAKKVSFNTVHFNIGIAGEVPYEGIPRMLTSTTDQATATTTRRGISFQMETTLLGTPEGLAQYEMNVAGIVQTCNYTVALHTIMALLRSKNYLNEMRQMRASDRNMSVRKILDREAQRFATLVRSDRDFDVMVNEAEAAISRRGATPTMMLIPPAFPLVPNMANTSMEIGFWVPGPDNEPEFRRGADVNGMYGGRFAVYTVNDYSTSQSNVTTQPLKSHVSLGEWYGMFLQRISLCTTVPFCTEHRDIFIYSSDANTFVRIPFVRMLEVSGFWKGSEHDQSAGALSQTIYTLRDSYNARLNEYNIDFRYYSNPQLVEQQASIGTKKGGRTLNMMLRVDAENDRVDVVRRLGDFDLDVITSAQMELMGQTIVDNLLAGAVPRADQKHQDFVKLIDEIEKVAYSEQYFAALAQANTAASVGADRTFIGDVVGKGATKTVQMKGNPHGGLDLPQFQQGYGEWPAGMANFPGLLTFQEQAVRTGWASQQQAPDGQQQQQGTASKLQRVESAIEYVSALTESLYRMAYGIDNFDTNAIPEWFVTNDMRVAVFEHLHGHRPPLFIRLPGNTSVTQDSLNQPSPSSDDNAAGVDAFDGSSVATLPLPATATDFLGALPKVKYATTAIKAADPEFNEQVVTDYFIRLSDVSSEQFKEAEKARQVLSTELYKATLSLLDSATTVKRGLKAFGAKISDAMTAQAQTTPENAKALAGQVKTLAREAQGEAGAAYINARSNEKKEIEADGKALIDRLSLAAYLLPPNQQQQQQQQQQGRGPQRAQQSGPPQGAVQPQSTLQAPLLAQLNEAIGPAPGATPLTNLHTAVEAVGKLMRQYLGPEDRKPVFANLQLVDSKVQQLPEEQAVSEKARIKKIVEDFVGAKSHVTNILKQYKTPVASSAQKSFLSAGAPIQPVQNEVFVRAPLTQTKKLIGDIAREQSPAIRPADPATGWRTPLMVWGRGQQQSASGAAQRSAASGATGSLPQRAAAAGAARAAGRGRGVQSGPPQRGTAGVNEQLLSLLNSPLLAMPSGTVWPPSSKEFVNTATFNSRLSHPEVMHQHLGLDTYVVPDHVVSGYVDDIDTGYDYAGDDYTIDEDGNMVTGAEAILSRQRMINRGRAARGLAPRDVYSEFAYQSVASHERQMQEAHAEQARRAQQMYAGAQVEPIGHETSDPLSGALQFFSTDATQRQQMADRLATVGPVTFEGGMPENDTFSYRWAKAQRIANPLKRLAVLFALSLPNNLNVLKQVAAQNVLIPFNIAVFRPYIEFQMYSALLLAGGFDTGVNIIGEEKQLSDVSAADGMFLSAYTFHHVSLLRRPENVAHLRHILPAGIIGGWGTEPFTSASQLKLDGEERPDLFAVVLPATTEWLPSRFNLLPMQTPLAALIDPRMSRHVLDEAAAVPGLTGTHSSARFFQEHWKITEKTLHFAECNFTFFNQGNMIDSLLSQGTWVEWNPGKQSWSTVVDGASALSGQLSRPGIAPFLEGSASGIAQYTGAMEFQ